MTDAHRRRLILLAEARATATSATGAVQRLVSTLEQIKSAREMSPDDPLYAPKRVAKDIAGSLIDIHNRLSQLISEVVP